MKSLRHWRFRWTVAVMTFRVFYWRRAPWKWPRIWWQMELLERKMSRVLTREVLYGNAIVEPRPYFDE